MLTYSKTNVLEKFTIVDDFISEFFAEVKIIIKIIICEPHGNINKE